MKETERERQIQAGISRQIQTARQAEKKRTTRQTDRQSFEFQFEILHLAVDWGSCAEYLNDFAQVIEKNPDQPIHVLTYEGLKKVGLSYFFTRSRKNRTK